MVSEIVVAISNSKGDDILEKNKKFGFNVFRGDEDDVLGRFYSASKVHNCNTIVRLTGDCPLIDSSIVDRLLIFIKK